jgi:hypothetical protein
MHQQSAQFMNNFFPVGNSYGGMQEGKNMRKSMQQLIEIHKQQAILFDA